jgi:hypothetical protein
MPSWRPYGANAMGDIELDRVAARGTLPRFSVFLGDELSEVGGRGLV